VRWWNTMAWAARPATALIYECGFGVACGAGKLRSRHTRVSQLKPGDIDWNQIFGKQGARWFHTGHLLRAFSDDPELHSKPCKQRGGTARSFRMT